MAVQFAHILASNSLYAYHPQLMECHIPLSLFNEPRTEAAMLSMTFLALASLSLIHASMLALAD